MKWSPAGKSAHRRGKPGWVDERSKDAEARPGFRPRKGKPRPPDSQPPAANP